MSALHDEVFNLAGWAPGEGVIAAEMAVAGAAIQSKEALDEALDVVAASDFYSIAKAAFAAAETLLMRGEPISPAAVLMELQVAGQMDSVDGPYLARLMEHAAVAGSVKALAQVVADDSVRRGMNAACRRGMQITENPAWEAGSDIDMIRKLVDEAAVRKIGERPQDVSQGMIDLLDDLENPPTEFPGVVPPFLDMQALVKSFQASQLIVVAGRPGLGKSVLAADFARRAAIRDGQQTIFFSMEMTERELLQRITAAEAKVPLNAIRGYDLTPDQLRKVAEVAGKISGAPLIIDEAPGCTLEHIRSQLRWLSRSGSLSLCVIDYLQIMQAPKHSRRDLELGEVTRTLKQFALEFGIPIVLLSQLNRGPEQRQDKRPALADLRDSGSIESDADIVILVHRDDAYDRESPRAGEADLIVAKNRSGPCADITVASQLHYSRFADMASDKSWSPSGGERPDLNNVE